MTNQNFDNSEDMCYFLTGGHICLDSCHFVFRLLFCILVVCLVQVFAHNIVRSLGCAVCFRLLVSWGDARDLQVHLFGSRN